ncbi:RNA-binding S4 domain-containing protein [Candidatus Woesearchaeota archaeon]|nr:RNA-binding S4 domain-containing protein [Candidatus Woesearchaeota archaeon]
MNNKYIELNAFLKLKGLASTGGQAKLLIRSEAVAVNGEKETKNKRKLIAGDKVSYQEKVYLVEQQMLKME